MRTTLDVDPELIAEAERLTGEATASKAVSAALREFVRKHKIEELRVLLRETSLVDTWRRDEEVELRESSAEYGPR